MHARLWVWLFLVLSFAVMLVVTVMLALHVVRRVQTRFGQRVLMALLPPWAAFESFRRGTSHVLPVLWAASVLVYLALRAVASVLV